jgi:4'-phosphopantetheinyl transferase
VLPLKIDHVSVFLTRVAPISAALGADMPQWLGEQEQTRYVAISAPRRRAQFVAGRWWVRQCLAAEAGGSWLDYVLSAPQDQAPVLLQTPTHMSAQSLHFSISHSADWLVCAIAAQPVGVDVEDTKRQRDTDALAEQIYGDQEWAMAQTLSPNERRNQFFTSWTLKEAWIKKLPPTSELPAMTAMQFMPCSTDDAQAIVFRSDAFTLAVLPATAASLRLSSLELLGLTLESWKSVGQG